MSLLSDECYTPPEITNRAACVLGPFMDPFSCHAAQELVQAADYLTIADDALNPATDWGRNPEIRSIWMNPPYSRGLVSAAIARFLKEWSSGRWDQAIVLVNQGSTAWWHSLRSAATAHLFVTGRVDFWRPTGPSGIPAPPSEKNRNRYSQDLFYFGTNDGAIRFDEAFQGWSHYGGAYLNQPIKEAVQQKSGVGRRSGI